jgi:hypothetical protein
MFLASLGRALAGPYIPEGYRREAATIRKDT